jgi:2,3-bisphosphoglycerate-independent phosphoglycerate mutase
VLPAHGILAITADHGNAELKVDPTGAPLTAHTMSPVPFIVAGDDAVTALRDGGKLGDVAPTLLRVVGLAPSAEMTGDDLTALTSPSPVRAG